MGYFQVRYDSRVVNYERKMFIRLATDVLAYNGELVNLRSDDLKWNSNGYNSQIIVLVSIKNKLLAAFIQTSQLIGYCTSTSK